MKKYEVLTQLSENSISTTEAYQLLYSTKSRLHKAHFIKMRISVKDQKGVTVFLKILFFLPIPVFIVSLILRIAFKKKTIKQEDIPIDYKSLIDVIHTKDIKINVDAKNEAKVYIHTF